MGIDTQISMAKGHRQPIIVVGGGIAGLTAAFRLQQQGFSVRVMEASERVGGRMTTLSREGYRIDLAVSVFPESYRCLRQLIQDAGLADEVVPTSDLAGVVRDGRVHRTRGSSKLDALATGLLSWPSKLILLRALADSARVGERLSWENLSLAADSDTESAADYAKRRLNAELLDYIVTPVCRMFCLAPPEEVSVVNLLFVLRHFIGARLFNSKSGVDFLPLGLARQLDVQLKAVVSGVHETANGVQVSWSSSGEPEQTEKVAGCVIALPAPQMVTIFPQLDPESRRLAQQLEYATAVGVHLGLSQRPASEDAMLLQVPAREHPDLSGIVLEHNKAPGRAPAGKGLISTLWQSRWGQRQWHRDDADIVKDAVAGVGSLFPDLVANVDFAHVQRWRIGPDIPHVGVHQAMRRFGAAMSPQSRVRLAGDYFSSASTNAAATSAEKAASELSAVLGAARIVS